jgi:HSP20 family protein
MHTIINPSVSSTRKRSAARASVEAFRQPRYECDEQPDAMKVVVYLPGIDATGVDIEGHGADLTVTARKPHFVRVNWQSLHLETAQRDYRLRLRLGYGFDFPSMAAEMSNGILTVTLPKRGYEVNRLGRVA